MAEEKLFENKIKKFIKTLPKAWFYKHWAGAYSQSGIPDIICCINGRFVGIEVKATNGKVSDLQLRNIKLINESGGVGLIVKPSDFDTLKDTLIKITKGDY